MKKKMLYLLFLSFLHPMNKKHTISNGFLIYFDFGWFFQPCLDSSTRVYECLDSRSFGIITGTDGYNTVLSIMEDSLATFSKIEPIFFNIRDDTTNYVGDLKYIYCRIEYENEQPSENTKIHPCVYTIENNGKTYNLFCNGYNTVIYSVIKLK